MISYKNLKTDRAAYRAWCKLRIGYLGWCPYGAAMATLSLNGQQYRCRVSTLERLEAYGRAKREDLDRNTFWQVCDTLQWNVYDSDTGDLLGTVTSPGSEAARMKAQRLFPYHKIGTVTKITGSPQSQLDSGQR